jgi:hypothetical protein
MVSMPAPPVLVLLLSAVLLNIDASSGVDGVVPALGDVVTALGVER